MSGRRPSRGGASVRSGLRSRLARRAREDSGFTLLELMIALMLLAIIMTSSLYSILQGMKLSRDMQDRVVAANLITGILEKLRSESLQTSGFANIQVTTLTLPSQSVSGTTYDFTETNEWVNRGSSTSACNSGSNSSLVLRSTVTSTWGVTGEFVSDSTLINPPNGTLTAGDGSMGVQVDNSTNGPFTGATVTASDTSLSPPVNQTITTGSDGCAYFAQLPPNTTGNAYTLTVSSTGAVDNFEQTTYTKSNITIAAGTPNTQFTQVGALQFDRAGTIDWTYSSSTPSPALNMGISVDNPSLGFNPGFGIYPFGSGGPITPVYPATYNDVFAGSCTDADPAGSANHQAFYPSATQNPVTVAPGGTGTVVVPLYPLNLQIVDGGGSPIANAASPGSTPPTATAGAAGITPYGGACPNGAPTYTLNAVANGASATGVGLGHLAVNVTVQEGGTGPDYTGQVNVWVQPDGVYGYDPSTGALTQTDGTTDCAISGQANPNNLPTCVPWYEFSSPGAVQVKVS